MTIVRIHTRMKSEFVLMEAPYMNTRQQMERINAYICQSTTLYGEWARQRGVSYNMLMILCTLDAEPCTQKQIAENWMIPKQTVNTIVKGLERQGLIRFAAERGQKEKLVCFTEVGQMFAKGILEEMYQMEDRVLERMGPELCEMLLKSEAAFAEALAREVHGG